MDSRKPLVNREYSPQAYDRLWNLGRQAAVRGQPRQGPCPFGWGWDNGAWLDGFDDVLESRQREKAEQQPYRVTGTDLFEGFDDREKAIKRAKLLRMVYSDTVVCTTREGIHEWP